MNINRKQGAIFGVWLWSVFMLNWGAQGSFWAALATTVVIGFLAIFGIIIGESL